MEDSRLDYLLLVAQVLLLPSSRWQRLRGPASAVITLITATLSPLSLSLHTSTLICIHTSDNNILQIHTMVFARNDMIGLLLCAIILMYWRNSEVFVAMFKGYQQKLYTFQIQFYFWNSEYNTFNTSSIFMLEGEVLIQFEINWDFCFFGAYKGIRDNSELLIFSWFDNL